MDLNYLQEIELSDRYQLYMYTRQKKHVTKAENTHCLLGQCNACRLICNADTVSLPDHLTGGSFYLFGFCITTENIQWVSRKQSYTEEVSLRGTLNIKSFQ